MKKLLRKGIYSCKTCQAPHTWILQLSRSWSSSPGYQRKMPMLEKIKHCLYVITLILKQKCISESPADGGASLPMPCTSYLPTALQKGFCRRKYIVKTSSHGKLQSGGFSLHLASQRSSLTLAPQPAPFVHSDCCSLCTSTDAEAEQSISPGQTPGLGS